MKTHPKDELRKTSTARRRRATLAEPTSEEKALHGSKVPVISVVRHMSYAMQSAQIARTTSRLQTSCYPNSAPTD